MNVPLEEVHRRQKLFSDTFLNYFLYKKRKYQNMLIQNGINLASGQSDFSINFETDLDENVDLILENGNITERRLLKRSSFSIRDIFIAIYHIIRQKKAAKIIQNMNHVQEFEIRSMIEEVAHEISIAYEYQLVALASDDSIVSLALYGVMCILTYLRGSTAEFTSGKLLQAILEVKPENCKFKKELKTRPINHGDNSFCWKWKISGILKQPGLCIRTKSSSPIIHSPDVEETVIIRGDNKKELCLESVTDEGDEIKADNLNIKYNICKDISQISCDHGCQDENLMIDLSSDVSINVFTEYGKIPVNQTFSEQDIITNDKNTEEKTDEIEVGSVLSSPSEIMHGNCNDSTKYSMIVHGNFDNDSTKYCRTQHKCDGVLGDRAQVKYLKGDNSCLAMHREDHTSVRCTSVHEFVETNNRLYHCDSDLAIKSDQIRLERHAYFNSGFKPCDEIVEEKGFEDQNCEISLLGMSSVFNEQKKTMTEKFPSESQRSVGLNCSECQITALDYCSENPLDCHTDENCSKIYIDVLENQCKRYNETVENQLEFCGSTFKNQCSESAPHSLDCVKCTSLNCCKAVKEKENDGLEFYGCFTPWGFRCQPHIYGFRGPLHVIDEDTGTYKMIYNDLVSIEPSHGRKITYDHNNPHQAYDPKTFCAH